MSDGIWSNRFVQRGTKPAWHHKGFLVGNQEMTAEQMLDMVGDYIVELRDLDVSVTTLNGKTYNLTSDYRHIVRHPTPEDPTPRLFGSPVHKSYELIGPRDAAQIWDRAVVDADGKSVPVETFGILHEGQEVFISAAIDSFDVKGDEINMYLLYYNPMYSNNAAICAVTGVRPVCQNTINIGIQEAQTKLTVVHTPGAKDRLEEWLSDMYQATAGILRTAKSDFERMAERHIGTLESKSLLEAVYPNPPEPKPEWDRMYGLTFEQHQERYQEKFEKVNKVRDVILGLFGGDGLGMDTEAADGTVFGLYGAVAEYEDNRRGTNEGRALGVTVGDRAAVVRKTYQLFSNFCSN